MYHSVHDTLKRFENVWEGIPKFEQAVQLLADDIAEITSLNSEIVNASTIASESKKQVEIELVDKLYNLVLMARSYAASEENDELMLQLKITKHNLSKGNVNDRIARYDKFISLVSELEVVLADYGVPASYLQEVIVKSDQFIAMVSKPREIIIQSGARRVERNALIAKIDTLIRSKIAGMVNFLEENHPRFAEEFERASIIVDYRNPKARKGGSSQIDSGESPFDSD